MDNRPIGFFDSGLGGLTTIPPLAKSLPEERIVYFGDTARTPYGSKAENTIKKFSLQIGEFLRSCDVKMIVIACNTVTSICLDMLREKFPDIPIEGVIDPAARKIAEICDENNNIGVIATKATIKNRAYENNLRKCRDGLNIFSQACPLFVPLIEEGVSDDEIKRLTVKYYLDDFISKNMIDTLVLGCTHYPFLKDYISALYPQVRIVDPSQEIIYRIKSVLESRDMLAHGSSRENTFYASDLSDNFINMINTIFDKSDFKVAFKNLEIK